MAWNRGAAEVRIDNARVDLLDGFADDIAHDYPNYSSVPRRQTAKTYSGLGTGWHTIQLVAKPGDSGTNRTYMDLDAFIIDINSAGIGTHDDTSSYGYFFGNWYTWYAGDAYGGSFKYSEDVGAGFRFTFSGSNITWYYTKANNRGKALVTIDGENKNWNVGYVDLYAPTTQRGQSTLFSDLGSGVHTITIHNIYQKNPASTGYIIDADKFVVSNISGWDDDYQHIAAANYADAWAHYINPYYDYFADNDCTNFSSQVLEHGGFPYYPSNPAQQYDWPEHWWWKPATRVSSLTWRYAPSFMTYQSGRPSEFERIFDVLVMRKGDLVPLDIQGADGNPGHDDIADHMRVVVGAAVSSPFAGDYNGGPNLVTNPNFNILVSQHTTDRWHVPWDYNTVPDDRLNFIVIKR